MHFQTRKKAELDAQVWNFRVVRRRMTPRTNVIEEESKEMTPKHGDRTDQLVNHGVWRIAGHVWALLVGGPPMVCSASGHL